MEEGHSGSLTAIPQLADPFNLARARTVTAFASCYDPVDAFQRDAGEWAKQWLSRNEANPRFGSPELIGAP